MVFTSYILPSMTCCGVYFLHSSFHDLSVVFTSYILPSMTCLCVYFLHSSFHDLSVFLLQNLKDFFSQMSSYVVMMDMLFENGMYEEVLKLMSFVTEQQLGGFKYPMDCVTLSTATCLKLVRAVTIFHFVT